MGANPNLLKLMDEIGRLVLRLILQTPLTDSNIGIYARHAFPRYPIFVSKRNIKYTKHAVKDATQ